MEGKVGGIVLALLIACGVVWYKYSNKSDFAGEVHSVAVEILERLPDYDAHSDEYNAYLDAHHEEAFNAHYRMGGKYSSTQFDEDAYWNDLFAAMILHARSDRQEELATRLSELHRSLMDG